MTGIKISFAIASSLLLVTNYYQFGTDALSHNIHRRNVQNDNNKAVEAQKDTSNIQQEYNQENGPNDVPKSVDSNKLQKFTQNTEQDAGTDTDTIKSEVNNSNSTEKDGLIENHQHGNDNFHQNQHHNPHVDPSNKQNHRDSSQQDHYFKHNSKDVYEAAIAAANYNCTEEISQEHTVIITEKSPHHSGYPNNLYYLPPFGDNNPPRTSPPVADILPPSIPVTDIPEEVTKNEILITTENAAQVNTIPVESSSDTEIPQIITTTIINNDSPLDKFFAGLVTDNTTNGVNQIESNSTSEIRNNNNLQVSGQSDSNVTVPSLTKAVTDKMEHDQGSQIKKEVKTIPVESSSATEIPKIITTPIIKNGLRLNESFDGSVTDDKISEVHTIESSSTGEIRNNGNSQVSGQSDSNATVQSLSKAFTDKVIQDQGSQTEKNDNIVQTEDQTKDGEVKASTIDINQSSNLDVTGQNCNEHNHNIEQHVHHYHHNIIHHQYDIPYIDYYRQHNNYNHYRHDVSYYPKMFNPYEFFTVNYGFLSNNNNNNKNYVSDNTGKSNTKPCSYCINSKTDPPTDNKNVK